MKRKSTVAIVIILCIIGIFIVLHRKPYIALRTHLFMTGYLKVALTSIIEDDDVHKDLESNSIDFYTVNKAPVDRATGNSMTSYKVTKKGFLYFAKYYGEA